MIIPKPPPKICDELEPLRLFFKKSDLLKMFKNNCIVSTSVSSIPLLIGVFCLISGFYKGRL